MAAKLPTILVIDDERNTREGLRDAFEDKYDILLADSAAAGLDVLKKRKKEKLQDPIKWQDNCHFIAQ